MLVKNYLLVNYTVKNSNLRMINNNQYYVLPTYIVLFLVGFLRPKTITLFIVHHSSISSHVGFIPNWFQSSTLYMFSLTSILFDSL